MFPMRATARVALDILREEGGRSLHLHHHDEKITGLGSRCRGKPTAMDAWQGAGYSGTKSLCPAFIEGRQKDDATVGFVTDRTRRWDKPGPVCVLRRSSTQFHSGVSGSRLSRYDQRLRDGTAIADPGLPTGHDGP